MNGPLLASAGLDRLAHNAHTLLITGTSYRARRGNPQDEEEPIDETDDA